MRRLTACILAAGALCIVVVAAASTISRADAPAPEPGRPNILVIVADDLGYSDLGAFGGEISTPHLDSLMQSGVKLTDFHAAPACAPTRAMLMTGVDSHPVGLGSMSTFAPEQVGKPGYEDALNDRAATVAERLAEAGYLTVMSGKWHLGMKPSQDPAARGFERSFALLPGGANHYGSPAGMMVAQYSENGKPATFPQGAYSSDYIADKLVSYLDTARSDPRPVFAYLAFTAPHWPMQAPPEIVAKYAGRYDAGPKALAAERLKRMQGLGLVAPGVKPHPMVGASDWSSLSPEARAAAARKMEVYAAMVERMDDNVGRVIEALRRTGRLQNTTIIFMSDNGAAGEYGDRDGQWGFYPTIVRMAGPEKAKAIAAGVDNSTGNIGRATSFTAYGPDWASAASSPYRLYKTFTSEGGIRTPAFVSGRGVAGPGRASDAFLNVTDITPTILDLAGVKPPATYKGRSVLAPTGRSWEPLLTGAAAEVRGEGDAVGWELFGGRAIRMGDWKATYVQPTGYSFDPSEWKPGRWELFDLRTDPAELNDLSAKRPEVMRRLMTAWRNYVAENGVIVLFDDDRPQATP